MTEKKELIDLERTMDELRLQAHLGRAELRAKIAKLESRWPEVQRRLREIEKEGEAALEEFGKSAKELLAELKAGYQELRRP